MNLAEVIEGLVEERGLDKEKVIQIVQESVQAAYAKKYPSMDVTVAFNKKSGSLEVFARKTVVASAKESDTEVPLRKARSVNEKADIGDVVDIPLAEGIGRIEILSAKQMIAAKIRELEHMAVYEEYKDRKGTIVNGTVHKRERRGYAIKIGDVIGLLPQEKSIPGEALRIGHPIKILLEDVFQVAQGDYQLIFDRASAAFVQKLLELEIPEIFEGVVQIKKIERIAGYKTKAVVESSSKDIDPVGTCVGVGGARIKPILRELGQEKIDLIPATESIERFIKYSLKPAEIDKVEILDDGNALVWLAEDQRSYAIGRMGQNIPLASKLTGVQIQLQDVASPEQLLNRNLSDSEDAPSRDETLSDDNE